ncbi:Berberine bridge enzyme-like 21 [Camellia lanceoleosa]|uniref:Berberine bridge enzyme-like 21 n=1 Tax=Camellia lanceoleosa TaxID=1840588 RepID=A0ACC0GJ80_9ERIC|nr:Berberine bridge enzyme-like 21 [Camellia lanceoleosa]
MEETSPSPFLLLLLPFLLLPLSMAASDLDTFVQCLSNHSIPQNQISTIVYAPNNPSVTTILQSYIRNRRFASAATPKYPHNNHSITLSIISSQEFLFLFFHLLPHPMPSLHPLPPPTEAQPHPPTATATATIHQIKYFSSCLVQSSLAMALIGLISFFLCYHDMQREPQPSVPNFGEELCEYIFAPSQDFHQAYPDNQH